MKQRTDSFRNDLRQFLKLNEKIFGALPQQGKVGIIGHSMFLKVYTTKIDYWDNP
jgi:hypothetical protein